MTEAAQITVTDIAAAVSAVTAAIGVGRRTVGVIYREPEEGDSFFWEVSITYRIRRTSNLGQANGHGSTPAEAANNAISFYRRHVLQERS